MCELGDELPLAVSELSAALNRSNENLRDSNQLVLFLSKELELAQVASAHEKTEVTRLQSLLSASETRHLSEREKARFAADKVAESLRNTLEASEIEHHLAQDRMVAARREAETQAQRAVEAHLQMERTHTAWREEVDALTRGHDEEIRSLRDTFSQAKQAAVGIALQELTAERAESATRLEAVMKQSRHVVETAEATAEARATEALRRAEEEMSEQLETLLEGRTHREIVEAAQATAEARAAEALRRAEEEMSEQLESLLEVRLRKLRAALGDSSAADDDLWPGDSAGRLSRLSLDDGVGLLYREIIEDQRRRAYEIGLLKGELRELEQTVDDEGSDEEEVVEAGRSLWQQWRQSTPQPSDALPSDKSERKLLRMLNRKIARHRISVSAAARIQSVLESLSVRRRVSSLTARESDNLTAPVEQSATVAHAAPEPIRFVKAAILGSLPVPWPRCQDLPSGSHSLPESDDLMLALSHGWPYQTHPDPTGAKARETLRLIACAEAAHAPSHVPSQGESVAFIDFLSVSQRQFVENSAPRSLLEEEAFTIAVQSMPSIYLSADCILHVEAEWEVCSLSDGEEYELELADLQECLLQTIGAKLQVVRRPPGCPAAPFDLVLSAGGQPVSSLGELEEAMVRCAAVGSEGGGRSIRMQHATHLLLTTY